LFSKFYIYPVFISQKAAVSDRSNFFIGRFSFEIMFVVFFQKGFHARMLDTPQQ